MTVRLWDDVSISASPSLVLLSSFNSLNEKKQKNQVGSKMEISAQIHQTLGSGGSSPAVLQLKVKHEESTACCDFFQSPGEYGMVAMVPGCLLW